MICSYSFRLLADFLPDFTDFTLKVRLVNLKPDISVLAGGKRPTGQTAPEKEAMLRKIDLRFFSASDCCPCCRRHCFLCCCRGCCCCRRCGCVVAVVPYPHPCPCCGHSDFLSGGFFVCEFTSLSLLLSLIVLVLVPCPHPASSTHVLIFF